MVGSDKGAVHLCSISKNLSSISSIELHRSPPPAPYLLEPTELACNDTIHLFGEMDLVQLACKYDTYLLEPTKLACKGGIHLLEPTELARKGGIHLLEPTELACKVGYTC